MFGMQMWTVCIRFAPLDPCSLYHFSYRVDPTHTHTRAHTLLYPSPSPSISSTSHSHIHIHPPQSSPLLTHTLTISPSPSSSTGSRTPHTASIPYDWPSLSSVRYRVHQQHLSRSPSYQWCCCHANRSRGNPWT